VFSFFVFTCSPTTNFGEIKRCIRYIRVIIRGRSGVRVSDWGKGCSAGFKYLEALGRIIII